MFETQSTESPQADGFLESAGNNFGLVSLFSGCGGMDLGFRGGFFSNGHHYSRLPFSLKWANDINAAACHTFAKNLKHPIHEGDIWQLLDTLPKASSTDIVIGGFPCQDISINGKRAGIDGARSGLYRAMVEVVQRLKPRAFVAENVKGLLMRHNAGALETVKRDFSSLGYSVNHHLYNAADFGVPQARERVLIVGLLGDVPFEHPSATRPQADWMTSEQAIRDLEHYDELELPNHIWSKAKKSADQGGRRLKSDRPAQTMRAECHGNIQFHYRLDRRISMREAARFQSFPDDFIFHAKLRETERQIGNAVPPVLAWHVARALASQLNK